MSKAKKHVAAFAAAVVLILAAAVFLYVNDYYRADETALRAANGTEAVTVTATANGLLFDGAGEDAALIFYPGAKVEYTAYAPLLLHLAENGVDCFLVKMPCNLAIFGVNSADKIMGQYSYERWYMAGHSLGGAMAAFYCAGHLDEFDGLILLAAYPTKSLRADTFAVLSVYGSEDGVLNREKLQTGLQYMPDDYTEICIEGGNHAGFGSYGAQDGDGEAQITHEEQWAQTAEAICSFIGL